MPAFIQLSDTHIVAKGDLACGHSDTATALETAVSTINERLDTFGQIDCVVITGDLTDHGTLVEYEHFLEIISALRLPWLAIPGNHDNHDVMRQALCDHDWMPASGPVHWHRDFGDFLLVGLDTLLDGAHHGMLCEDGFAYLDSILSAAPGRPLLVATHHPFMHSGIPAMDLDNLRNGDQLMKRLEEHQGPVQMISGHVHRSMTAQIGRVSCQIGPSTAHAVHFDTRSDAVNSLTLEPGGFLVHTWLETPHPALVSSFVPTGTFPGPWPFS